MEISQKTLDAIAGVTVGLVALFCIIFLSGCGPSREEYLMKMRSDSVIVVSGKEYRDVRVRKIDGCEYIIYSNGNGAAIVHKANCKNHE